MIAAEIVRVVRRRELLDPYRLSPLYGRKLQSHTSFGSDPLIFLTGRYVKGRAVIDGDVMCAECADALDPSGDDGEIVMVDVHWEGPPDTCCECNCEIESAYGDPDDGDPREGDYSEMRGALDAEEGSES